MKLTKQIGKTVMVCMLALVSMTGMVFASGSNEITTSPVISTETWAGVIDGIAIDLTLDAEKSAIEGTVRNLTNGDLSMVQLNVTSAQNANIASVVLGTPGDLEFHDTMIKEDTVVFAAGASDPVMLYLSNSQFQDLLNNGWKLSIDSDNAPRYGLFEKGELLVNDATALSDSFVINEDGVQTVVSYDYGDEGFSGTVTNYTNAVINAVETTIALNNGSVYAFEAADVQPGETVSFFYGAGYSGFSMYAVETIIQ